MNDQEIARVQAYLRGRFNLETIVLKRVGKSDCVEMYIEDEFVATINRDDEDGDVSYALNMAILDFDLPEVP
ncbi:MAG: DUF3126 family protein [Parvibaculales bacterium]